MLLLPILLESKAPKMIILSIFKNLYKNKGIIVKGMPLDCEMRINLRGSFDDPLNLFVKFR